MTDFLDPPALLHDLTVDEFNGGRATAGGVSVRDFPFPYRAGFAISNDCDSFGRAAFEDWHAVLNGSGTIGGRDGLNLEIGDSYWGWIGHVVPDGMGLHDHYPDDEPRKDSANLARIVELGQAGWLDTMHSLGNWRLGPGGAPVDMARDQVVYLLDRLDSLGLYPNVLVNHSASPSNVGGPWGWYQGADDPEHPLYCLDLLKSFGFRFHWLDVFTIFDGFGSDLQLESRREVRQRLHQFNWGPWLRRRKPEGGIAPVVLGANDAEIRQNLIGFLNRTLMHVEGRDGTPILAFKRQRGWDQPVMDGFPVQVTEADLDMLERRRGAAIIYQHFGLSAARGRWPSPHAPKRTATAPPVLDEHAYDRFRELSDRHRNGRILVATTGRLLQYLHLRDRLDFGIDRSDERWVLHVHGIDCPVSGHRKVEAAEINGLSFCVPADAPEIAVEIAGASREFPFRRQADPDSPDRTVLFLPWSQLEWPN